MNLSALVILLVPIAFIGVGYSSLASASKLSIGLCLLIFAAARLTESNKFQLTKAETNVLIALISLVCTGFIGLIDSPYISLTNILISIQLPLFAIIFLQAKNYNNKYLSKNVGLYLIAIYTSLIFFSFDVLATILSGNPFIDDFGVKRFSPSLGPSAGSIYLMVSFIALVGLPRLSSRFVHWSAIFLVGLLILLTSTRIALASMAISYFYLSGQAKRFNKSTRFKKLLAFLMSVSLVVAAVYFLKDRLFFEGSEAGLDAINTNGRMGIWTIMLDQASERIWFGHGWGASNLFLTTTGFGDGFGIQPHSDYIRLIFDAGIIGLLSFLICILLIWRALGSGDVDESRNRYIKVAKAYLLILLIFMLTDNVFIYHFYTYPALLFVFIVFAGNHAHAPNSQSRLNYQYSRALQGQGVRAADRT